MKIIRDADFGLETKKVTQWRERATVRAVLQHDGKVAVMHFTKTGIYMLPGGAIEGEESINQGLRREIKEETGATIKVIKRLGTVKELRSHNPRRQLAHGFLCDAKEFTKQSLTKQEKAEGVQLEWLTLDEALTLFKTVKRNGYNAHFHCARDTIFLEAAKVFLEHTA